MWALAVSVGDIDDGVVLTQDKLVGTLNYESLALVVVLEYPVLTVLVDLQHVAPQGSLR